MKIVKLTSQLLYSSKFKHRMLNSIIFSQYIDITRPIYEVEDDKDRWKELATAAVDVVEHLDNVNIIYNTITIYTNISIFSISTIAIISSNNISVFSNNSSPT